MTPIASSLKGLGTAGLAAAGVGGGLYAVKEGVQAILDKTQEFQQIRKRLDYAFGGAEEGGKQLDFVRGVVERLGLDMVSAANGYAQLAAATKDLNISHAQTQQIFSGVANAVAAMNLSADEANGVFLALSQIAGKGKVSMEELRGQLGEQLSPAMAIAAKSMGVTTAELEKMVESGISAEEFLPKFGAALEQAFAADAARNVQTLNGQINLLKNRFAELLNGFGEGGVAEAAIAVLQDVGEMLDWLEERINGMDATVSGGLKDTFVSAYEGPMTLMGNQLRGSRIVQAYQRPEQTLPVVGQRYCLKSATAQQYMRVMDVQHEVRTFETPEGKEFQRRVVKMEISDALVHDFPGVAYPSPTYANPPSQLLETQVADTASYYGVRPLAAPITAQSGMIQVDQIYEKLVPTSIIETAFADQFPTGAGVWIPTAPRRRMAQIAGSYSGDIYLESSVQPGTVELPGYTDDGQGHLKKDNSGDVLAVDYEKGVIRAASGFDLEVLAVPAARYSAANYTAIINVDDTNQGTEWAPLLRPKPAPGATAVSFISGGNWYTLTDNGDYVLRDVDGTVRGRVERSGSVLISLPAQPDVDSKIVVAWSPLDAFKAIDGQEPGNTVTLPPVQPTSRLTDNSLQNIKPGTLRLGWSHNGSKSASDSNGALSGDVQGAVDYAQGIITLQNAPNAAYSVTADVYTEQRTVKQMALTTNADLVGGTIGPCQAGTVLIEVTATFSESESKSYWDWSAVNGFGQSARRGTRTHSSRRAYAHAISDDGNGGLVLYGKKLPGATINYVSGTFSIPLAALARDARHIRYQDHQIDNKATPISISVVDDGGPQRKYSASVSAATVSYIAAGAATRRLTLTLSNNSQAANVLQNKPWPRQCLLNSWVFRLGNTRLIERDGTLYKNIDPKTGNGEAVGYLDALSGELVFKDAGASGDVVIEAGVYSLADMRLKQYYGRTPAAPVKPQSFTVYAEAAGHTRTGTSQADESITGEITGHIDTETGFFRVACAEVFAPESLRFNVVSQSYIPLDSSIIGIDAVRLPPDGKVPIFRRGDMIVIGNKRSHDLGSAHSAGQTVSLGRADIDRASVVDAAGVHVDAGKYDIDLRQGKLTWADPLDLSGHTMPLTAHTAQEEENRVVNVDISGRLKLQFQVARAYPKEGTYVSSALVAGDLLVRHTAPFAMQSWGRKWLDRADSDPILAKLNVKDYPIKLVSAGAITERWLILFDSDSQFKLYGEHLGLVLQGDTLNDLAPANPATGKPYFTLPKFAFGGGWMAGNCVRFNTFGTPWPIWILRAVQPSPTAQKTKDGFTGCLRGNTVDI